jgi:hypothetical protein
MESNSTAFLIKIKLRQSLGRPSRSDFVQSEVVSSFIFIFFEKIRLLDIPKDIPRHIPIPIPAMLFKTFIKTTLQSIAAVIPIVTPIITFLIFISFILSFPILLCDYDFSFRIQKRCNTGSKSGVPTKVINPILLIYKDLTNSFIFKPTFLSECNFKSFFFLCHVYFSFFQALNPDFSVSKNEFVVPVFVLTFHLNCHTSLYMYVNISRIY